MTYLAHRDGDLRACGATTTVIGQTSVTVNGKLWAVLGDPNTHLLGNLDNTTGVSIFINKLPVIVHGPDLAINTDGAGHIPLDTRTGAGAVSTEGY